MIRLDIQTPYDVQMDIAHRVKQRRREKKLTQVEMAKRSGMSLGSYKRFEQTGLIAFDSLIRIAFVLKCQQDFDELFSHRIYSSIQEIIDEQK